MSKAGFNQLHLLISSLTKAEKRHFKLYSKRNFEEKDVKFLVLFDLLDKQKELNVEQIRKKFSDTTGSALSNLRYHLYEQLLISLRLLHHQDTSIRIEELISFARVLYDRGLYLQSLEQLNRAKNIATTFQNDLALYNITDLERKIELFYVTESGYDRAQEIVDSNELNRSYLIVRDQWSNLALMLYDYYLKYGHVKNKRQYLKVKKWFEEEVFKIKSDDLSVHGKIYMNMAYTWFHFITQNFLQCYRHASHWVEDMSKSPEMMEKDPIMYLKGLHNILSALFYSNKPRQFEENYRKLQDFIELNEQKFNQNTRITANIYRYMDGLNQFFLQGDFSQKDEYLEEILQWLDENSIYLDQNRVQVFHYKIACLYFGAGDFKKSIFHLNYIINNHSKEKQLKQDVQCFSRILNLVAHYELENDKLVEYQLKSTYRYLIKYGDLQLVQKHIIDFIRRSVYMNRREMIPHFRELKEKLEEIFDDPYEGRPLLYLDLISWLSSKVNGKKVEEVIRERQVAR